MQGIWNGIATSLRLGYSSTLRSLPTSIGATRAGWQFSIGPSPTDRVRSILSNISRANVLVTPIRTITIDYWPRPRETKRINKHGWKTRVSTPAGRRIIMRRILKGRYILSH